MEKEKIREIIIRLRAVRIEKDYSYQKIVDLTEEIGDPVSMSTVRRIFTDDSQNFRWDTIKPIARVLLGVGFETPKPDENDPEQPQRYYAVIEGLKAVVKGKEELLETKERSINFLKRQLRIQQIATTILSAILATMLLVDFFNRNIGFFWIDR